ncbi:hypothetical protein JAAARDRAFT_54404 [Jaapia argillacea MUCL 33604]|uniref:DUF6589 domain-containing protein n=1 Tax=Jaapia argillacea MUCL 33604 TaxID=933084 RepID=A0A067QG40_9AGAM|nr:hypothetical protein JAAARDRAFT_54404 [Jaapia argillacea MUCL 33604]
MGDHVVLVHSDLATCERVQGLQQSWVGEDTPWLQFQFVVFVPRLFHLKMAAADAMWKIFIFPKKAHEDDTSLFKQVSQIRPKEMGKIASKPGFRRMHEIIHHCGAASRLNAWATEVMKRHPEIMELEEWELEWEELDEIAKVLIKDYNTLLKEKWFLLYEELSHAMNVGDIGRVEDCLKSWIFIFRGCRKHKYASQMAKFLHDLYFVYPECLRRTIRMNILCNPQGKANHFRAIDWWVELNNLYIKRIYGSQFSNRTKARILKQSTLIEVFRNLQGNLEKTCALSRRSYKHSPPKMQRTFQKLRVYMKISKTHQVDLTRTTSHVILDFMEEGMMKMIAGIVHRRF